MRINNQQQEKRTPQMNNTFESDKARLLFCGIHGINWQPFVYGRVELLLFSIYSYQISDNTKGILGRSVRWTSFSRFSFVFIYCLLRPCLSVFQFVFCFVISHSNGCLPRSFWFKYFLHGSVCCTIIFFSIKFFVAADLMVSDEWCCCCCCNWCCGFVIASLIVDLMLFDAIDGFLSLFDAPPVG